MIAALISRISGGFVPDVGWPGLLVAVEFLRAAWDLAGQSDTRALDQFMLDVKQVRRMVNAQVFFDMMEQTPPFVTGGLNDFDG
jgi:hypothetical protein